MSTRAKDLFEARAEYPLPKKAKTKDYIFYFVPATDPYGGSARKFLSKFYAAHVDKSVSSIEEMIGYLDDQVAAGVDHIREVVIVAHANPRGMVLKLLADATATHNSEYRYVTFESLAILQKDFAEGKFATFKKNRARVIEHLTDASWVTIRGCRFGQGTEAMYALYAFFGGRANVYAPRYYQFFGYQEIGWKAGEVAKKRGRPIEERPPRKFENRLEAHDHLVRQRFYPKHLHTDERKDAIVQYLADPGMYSETVELASATNPASDSAYAKLIVDLDAKRIPATVKTKLAEADHVLTERASVEVVSEASFWKIHDRVKHGSVTYRIEYEVWQAHSGGGHVALQVAAKLVVRSTGETLPFQSFFYESENDLWRGKVFTSEGIPLVLASYTEDPKAIPPFDADKKAAFDQAIATLDGGRLLSGSTNLVAPFAAEDLEITEAARVTHGTTAGTGPWIVTQGAASYLVKLEHPLEGHALSVFKNLDAKAKNAEEHELMSWLGNDADTPGPELAAYLDTIATDDLVAIIDYLRDPYRAENSFYIFHALHALQRKRDYRTWWVKQIEAMPKNEPLPEAPYLDLSRMEYADKDALVYSFRFNEHWAEVKTSFPKMPQFTGDLFDIEHDLWTKFREGDIDRNAPTVEADSPGADIEEARRLAREGNEKYFKDPKATLEPPPETGEVSCEELAALIEKLKTLEGVSLGEIEKQLSLTMGPNNKTLYETFKDVNDLYGIFDDLRSGAGFQSGALDAIGLVGDIIALDLKGVLSNELTAKIVERIPWFRPSAIGTPSTVGVAFRAFGVLSVALMPLTEMWMHVVEEQARAVANWKNRGKIAAVRRYLHELWDWTRTPNFPDRLVIEIDPDDYEDIYFAEVDRFRGGLPQVRFLMYGEDLKEGFSEGLKLMEPVGKELVAKADEAIADALREMDLDPCKTKVLLDTGFLDMVSLRAQVIRALASRALDEVPGL